ncbi:MAG: hypothetical protein MUE73_00015 [Planctomycetes bacterium]|jgi:hypothetical protein|nr:hypothetical protein [Planctomycetota bacterium]
MNHVASRPGCGKGNREEHGTVLVVGLVLLVAIGGLAMAMTRSGVGEAQLQSSRAQGLRAYYVAEGGLQASIVDIKSGGSGNIGSSTAPLGFGGGTYWVRAIPAGDTFTITSCGILGAQRRAVEMVLAPEITSPFAKALFGDLDLRGTGNIFADSYDTTLGTYASQAVHVDPKTGETYARAHGHLGSNGNIQISGSVTVFGDVTPGPGHAVLISGSSYISGSTTPAAAPSPLAPVKYEPPIPASGSLNSSRTLNAGIYHYTSVSLTASRTVTCNGAVTVYVDGDFKMSGQSQWIVNPGAKVVLYHRGSTLDLTGQGLLNCDGLPANFVVYSVATSVAFTGSSGFHGALYAPNAVVTPVGTTDIFGSFVGRQIKISGGATFHYDESLSKTSDWKKTLHSVSVRRAPFPEN